MKLSVELLDNEVKSAVINIGANSGYVEAFIAEGVLHLNVFNREGDVVHRYGITTKDLRAKGGWTAPKFEPYLD
jgi:protein-L-isoaspartate O-methyltransferase